MKKISISILVLVLFATFAFAEGDQEVAEEFEPYTGTLTVLLNGKATFPAEELGFRDESGILEQAALDFEAENDGVSIEFIYRDVSKGSLTFDTLLAAGNPPDIWMDASGYFENLLNEDYAIRLDKYLDLSIFDETILSMYTTSDGKVFAVPFMNVATGMAVNLTMLRDAGMEMPAQEDWTTDNFLKGAEALKRAGYPATMIMGSEGLNGWTCQWLYAFGAKFFEPGDWSKVAINSPEARDALAYIRLLIDSGYAQPNVLSSDANTGVELFTTNQVFSCTLQNGHTDPLFPIQLEKGKIDAIPDYTFVEFPHAPGMDHAPVSGYQSIMSAHKSGDPAKDAMIVKLFGSLNSYETQHYYIVVSGGFPTLKGLAPTSGMAALPSYKAIANLAATAGVYKQWPDGAAKNAARRPWERLSEQWVRGKITADELLNAYEAEANAALAELE
jgi:ABC-type glycerol-3-phosphate transport system substrate-binding protein